MQISTDSPSQVGEPPEPLYCPEGPDIVIHGPDNQTNWSFLSSLFHSKPILRTLTQEKPKNTLISSQTSQVQIKTYPFEIGSSGYISPDKKNKKILRSPCTFLRHIKKPHEWDPTFLQSARLPSKVTMPLALTSDLLPILEANNQ